MKNNFQISNSKQSTAYAFIKKDGTNYFSNYLLIVLSSIIATIGLLRNSTELIISSMLISPVMTIILANSLSIIVKDKKTLIKVFILLILSTVVCILIAIIITLVWNFNDLTKEIMSRTKPSFNDLIIAGVASLAATYTKCHNEKASILTGTAIAVSLVPPLCVTGITLAYNDYSLAFGAVKLYLINLIGIIIISALAFKFMGFKKTN